MFIGILLFANPMALISNNLTISNVSLTGQNTAEDYAYIRFDISWENSWRTSSAPNNHDAAWVFAKYRVGSGTWNHVMLSPSGHIAPAGSTLDVPPDLVGAFFYRDADGSGTFTKTGVKLRWNYGASGIGEDDVVDVKVFGLEMVYVPEGAFWVGSPGVDAGGKLYTFNSGLSFDPFQINNEDEIQVGNTNGFLYYTTSANRGDGLGPIPAGYPKGFNAFYVMKTEMTNQCYVDFLNMQPRNIQNVRISTSLEGEDETVLRYVMVTPDSPTVFGSATPDFRSPIKIDATFSSVDPLTFYCDLDNDDIPNEINDGQSLSCAYLSWNDAMAYLDWAGLRPMTELEFEKSCRGPIYPVSGEQAWGSSSFTEVSSTLINPGESEEISSNINSNINCNNLIQGPTRAGMFAMAGKTRIRSGATYYGILDMGGNLWERPVTLGNPTGRAYNGMHGNGSLNSNGEADVIQWPGALFGPGFRGGYFESTPYSITRVADRSDAAHGSDRRRNRFGGRGVRTAPSN